MKTHYVIKHTCTCYVVSRYNQNKRQLFPNNSKCKAYEVQRCTFISPLFLVERIHISRPGAFGTPTGRCTAVQTSLDHCRRGPNGTDGPEVQPSCTTSSWLVYRTFFCKKGLLIREKVKFSTSKKNIYTVISYILIELNSNVLNSELMNIVNHPNVA